MKSIELWIKYGVSLRNKSKAVSGSAIDAWFINAAVEPSVFLKKRSKNEVIKSKIGRNNTIANRFIKFEKVTNTMRGSLIFIISVIRKRIGLSNIKALAVMKILNNKLPNATYFLEAFSPIALNTILIMVPVSLPRTIAAAMGNPIAPGLSALNVSAIIAELD